MDTITYYFAPHSPWTYLGHDELGVIAARHGARIDLRPCDLAQVFGETGGVPLARRAPARQAYRLVELERWREVRALPLNLQPAFFPVDPKPASLAIIAALREAGPTAAFELSGRLMRAVWAEQRNIADTATLGAICAEAGLDANALLAASPDDEAEFAANTQAALSAGVFGAPWYRFADENFWGQDRLMLLERALGRR